MELVSAATLGAIGGVLLLKLFDRFATQGRNRVNRVAPPSWVQQRARNRMDDIDEKLEALHQRLNDKESAQRTLLESVTGTRETADQALMVLKTLQTWQSGEVAPKLAAVDQLAQVIPSQQEQINGLKTALQEFATASANQINSLAATIAAIEGRCEEIERAVSYLAQRGDNLPPGPAPALSDIQDLIAAQGQMRERFASRANARVAGERL
jgi:chromosome segregation ATPase